MQPMLFIMSEMFASRTDRPDFAHLKKAHYRWLFMHPLLKTIKIFIICSSVAGCSAVTIPVVENLPQGKINGMSLESPANPVDSTDFAPLRSLHINAIAIIPYAFSRNGEPKVYFNNERQWWGERIEGVAELIDIAHSHHFMAMVKPHVWMHHDWIGDYKLDSKEEWTEWEKSYSKYILAYAEMAQEHHAEVFCIGTELKFAADSRSAYFRSLITRVRKVFYGKVTYAANWDSYQKITFWDDLDYIGINAYFPLSQKDNPDLKELEMAWKPIIATLDSFRLKFGKPILITEIGYRSVNKAAGNQWDLNNEPSNDSLQSKAYEAFFATLYPKQWIQGAFLWKWEFDTDGEDRTAKLTTYTPQGKPAKDIISTYFRKYESLTLQKK